MSEAVDFIDRQADLPRPTLEKILYRNAERMFGLPTGG